MIYRSSCRYTSMYQQEKKVLFVNLNVNIMKINNILKFISIGLFLITLLLNLEISVYNGENLSLNLNGLFSVSSAQAEDGDRYEESFGVYSGSCFVCHGDPLGNFGETCECLNYQTQCFLDPNGIVCNPWSEWVITGNCVPTGQDC